MERPRKNWKDILLYREELNFLPLKHPIHNDDQPKNVDLIAHIILFEEPYKDSVKY